MSLPRGRRAYRAINDQLQSGSANSAQAFVQVRAPMAVAPGVVAAARPNDSSDAIRRLESDIMSLIGPSLMWRSR